MIRKLEDKNVTSSPLGTCLICTLTEDERRYLAIHARYAASSELDPRSYLTGELNPDGTQKTRVDWDTRQKLHDRWQQIADWLHPNPNG